MKDSIKVAGVTFDNPNGINRQTIIANIGKGWRTARLRQTTFEGNRAVEVRIDGLLVGYVPRTMLGNPLSNAKELTAYVDFYGDKSGKWFITLYERIAPSGKQYAYMKKLCLETKRTMPAYDERAYAAYFATIKA